MNRLPEPGTPAWVELPAHYVAATRAALTAAGIPVSASWIDPRDPRDATIVLAAQVAGSPLALVWDECSGWRHGRFAGGRKGVRTVLRAERSFGGELMPEPEMVAAAVGCLLDGTPVGRPERPFFRHFDDLGDGTDERLAAYAAAFV